MEPQTPGQLLTPKETCGELKVSPGTLHKLIVTGELPSLKIGKARRIRRVDLEAFIESRLTGVA